MIKRIALFIIFINLIGLLWFSQQKRALANEINWFFEEVALNTPIANYDNLINEVKYAPNHDKDERKELARMEGLKFLNWIKKTDSIYQTSKYKSSLMAEWRDQWPTLIYFNDSYSTFTLPPTIAVPKSCSQQLKRFVNNYLILEASRKYTTRLHAYISGDYCVFFRFFINSIYPEFEIKAGSNYQNWFYLDIHPYAIEKQPPVFTIHSNNQALNFEKDRFILEVPHKFDADSIELELRRYSPKIKEVITMKHRVEIIR